MHKRLAFIDTLRGIAVLAVLVQHVFEVILEKHPTGVYYGPLHDIFGYYMNFGRFGVVLFFFVSGFVIPFSFPDSATPVRDFTISRFFRLYPAYWTSIVVGLVSVQLLDSKSFPLGQIAANVTMLQTFVNVPNLWVFYWTLAIELLFYVGCTILFAMGLLNRRFTAVTIVVAAALVGTTAALFVESRAVSSVMEVGLNLSAMFLGKIIRDTVIGGKLRWTHVTVCTLLYAVFAATLSDRRFGGVYHENFFYSYSIGSAYISAALVFIGFAVFGERMAWRPMAFVGVISYSVYLMSPFAIVYVHRLVWFGDGPLGWSIFLVVILALSILVSWMTYTFIEKPSISFGQRFRSARRKPVVLEPVLSTQGAAE
ncbi:MULTISPECIES: acyltransferase [Bradyrhizobium]|uniref:Acyltransferase n=1 Tax=Bradyrhizobium yuanmingense TaxID=108015 RepID=A0A0R3CV74_9BRAD|nr:MULTISPECIES: acyltransferase [Bradyrhizobium]KRQ01530.1 acyltransferase [Bradyrhizobium yuanmingense]MCA1426826.1 acyltransferase [Bradyrhizobium sp. NBAIM16]MCA1495173.1 acyltransferase [Bradyrhizobium sp. NBAIM14]MCA1505613.1 acyltransferase [Bradyrhizobium sp. NBAIM02]MCA1515895.1 acyltransferase [Bradyrhizobium sp. NBAIM01]